MRNKYEVYIINGLVEHKVLLTFISKLNAHDDVIIMTLHRGRSLIVEY